MLKINPGFNIVDIRGNINTRLKKMEEGYCTAMVMAAAGLQRLGLGHKITEILDPEVMIPAVSQGAIAVEISENNPEIADLISTINDDHTLKAVKAERTFLNILEGGCQVPVGCFTKIEGNTIRITGFISNLDGTGMIKDTYSGALNDANEIAKNLAQLFIKKGAGEILENIRKLNNG